MYLTIQGIVLRVTDYNDRDALLTVLTRRHGRLTIKARGLRRKNSLDKREDIPDLGENLWTFVIKITGRPKRNRLHSRCRNRTPRFRLPDRTETAYIPRSGPEA